MRSAGPRRPNLFIVGAMKSGTSSLHRILQRHPQIFMCEPKEPCHFVERSELAWPAIEKLELWRESNYLRLFEAAGEAEVLGESSTLYSKLPRIRGVAERIASFQPEGRIIYLMRDPVERTISHYWHSVRWEGQRRQPLDAIRSDPHYREVSHYAMQLEPYLRLFGPERVRALTTEELARDPERVVGQLYSWLGVDPSLQPDDLPPRANVTPGRVSQVRGFGLLERLRWSRFWDGIGPLVPTRFRALGRRAASKEVVRDESRSQEAVAFLRESQVPETRELQELLGRDFEADWTTLFGE